jgi:hypothetical protein
MVVPVPVPAPVPVPLALFMSVVVALSPEALPAPSLLQATKKASAAAVTKTRFMLCVLKML